MLLIFSTHGYIKELQLYIVGAFELVGIKSLKLFFNQNKIIIFKIITIVKKFKIEKQVTANCKYGARA